MDMNQEKWLALKDRALAASSEGITIADARLPERPLIYVNQGFERLTGYSAEEALGKSCRFLQGEDADPKTIQVIRDALDQEHDCTVELLNRRKDGTPFWNRLSITPVSDAEGRVTHFVGIQSDVTQRRLAEEGLQRANEDLEQANLTMQRDLTEAAQIQRSWLPQSLPEVKGFQFAWSFIPCQELAGDSLNVIRLDDDHVGIYVLDVTGHGVGAALLSASIQRWLSPVPGQSCLFVQNPESENGYEISSPAAVATELNSWFQAEPKSGKFFTLIYGVLDLRDGDFRYTTAGHPPPLRIGADGAEVCPLARGIPIGMLKQFDFGEARLRLEPGDRLLLYTDGVPEAADASDQLYGTDRLVRDMEQNKDLSPDEALGSIMENLRRWGGSEAMDDDVTFLLVDAEGVEP
jgi:sigma-B regulation protein RsbU (phosphoserine phosphatase)